MFKKTVIIITLAMASLIGFSYLFNMRDGQTEAPVTEEGEVVKINNAVLSVEIANEPAEHVQGLSGRSSLADNQGMLFVFSEPIITSFWMKDMRISLDMIWIDIDGKIVGIEKYVTPETYPKTFNPPSPIKYVLEVNAGWSDKNKIKTGDIVKF